MCLIDTEITYIPYICNTKIKENVYDYVLNKNSKKFHYDWCGSAKKMKDSNKKYVTGARDEVIAMGYDPCKNCNP